MKIAVMGSGGVGGFFGGHLARVGHDVRFVARGAHLQAMRQQGLKISSAAHGDVHLPQVTVTDDPATIGPVDLILIAVKLWDLDATALAIKPLVRSHTAVLSLQNGVVKDDVLRRHFGDAAVMGGVAYVATRVAEPGIIEQTGNLQRLIVGEYDGSPSQRAQTLLDGLLRAGIDAARSPDIRLTLWEKYVFLVGLSGSTATMRSPIGAIRSNARTRAFLFDLMQETVAVGRALGVNLPSDYAEQRLAFADSLAPDMTSSLHHDLERGNRLEVEWLSGGVVTLGEQVGVPTPANRAVWSVLALHEHGRGD
ncbi:MAG: 2-dehydropantoate 2-reductase [Pseudomonadota bacterium]